MNYKNRKKLKRKIKILKRKTGKKLSKLRRIRNKYLDNSQRYFREDRRQAMKMKSQIQ